MSKEPLYPHVPKSRELQFPHVPRGRQPVEKLPQTLPQTGTCYEDAWRFLIKEEEGELIHGTVFSGGRRTGHAWVETESGYIWEPETGKFFTVLGFADVFAPVIESRYTTEEAAIMTARTKNLGPWSAQERVQYLGVRQPQTVPKRTILTVVCAYCGKYITKNPGYGVSGVSHGICKECEKIELEKFEAEVRAAKQPGAKLPSTEKLQQRGTDGYPIGADKIMRDAYGPIPDPDQPFWGRQGFVKPVKIYGWQWAPDYGTWRAYVRFPDGEETWTSPRIQTVEGWTQPQKLALAKKHEPTKPSRDDVDIGTWAERDRMGIWLTDKRTNKTIAEWWDEDAREMFDQGFFKPGDIRHQTITGRAFEDSVLDYAESVGIIAGVGKLMPQMVPPQYRDLIHFIHEPLPKDAD